MKHRKQHPHQQQLDNDTIVFPNTLEAPSPGTSSMSRELPPDSGNGKFTLDLPKLHGKGRIATRCAGYSSYHILMFTLGLTGVLLTKSLVKQYLNKQSHTHILYEQDTSQQMSTTTHNNSIDISNLRQKLIGVIFDSAPGYYDGRIDDLQSALEYVSSNIERKDLLTMTKTLEQNVVRQRFAEFWNGLSNDSTNIPQLYLFSQCDNLASSKHIEMLIEYRKDEIGMKRKIWKHKFLDSDHCCHLLKYPQEYSKSIKEFLSFCIREGLDNDSFIKSRL